MSTRGPTDEMSMRSLRDIQLVLALLRAGLNDCEISRRTGIPRATVRDWRHGR